MEKITCVEDMRALYARRAPKMFYDYTESGSWTETTFRQNASDFARIGFRQKVAVDISNRSLSSHMAGLDVSMPVALAPVGMTGMQSADGEIKAASAAASFGVPFAMSTMSICSMEDLADAVQTPFLFQVYALNDDAFMANLIRRAKAVGCPALILTLDLQVQGQRHKDIKNGLSAPPRLTPRNVANMATKLKWCWGMARTRRHSFGNLIGHARGVSDMSSLATWTAEAFDQALDWGKIAKIRDAWGGKIILKGILEPDDAVRAAALGVDAIVVSNHGGRQLDGAMSTIRALPAIIDAVGDRVEVHLDSGIRSGQDVLKAVALGAKGVYIGRAYIYGLGAHGEAGVTRVLEILRKELDVTMALCGCREITAVTSEILHLPSGFPRV